MTLMASTPQLRRIVWHQWSSVPSDRVRRGMRAGGSIALPLCLIWLCGCEPLNHFLIHPHEPAPKVIVWSADFTRDQLQVHIEGARPPGTGPFPTVIVHPEEDHTAADMHGVIWDLAARGYVAIAVDYQRWIDGGYRRNYFAWRTSAEVTMSIGLTKEYPEVDQSRIGALGFSEGAVISLLMAEMEPDRIKAVVAYYPIVDFPDWYKGKRGGLSPRILFALARWQLRADSGAANDEDFQRMMRLASPLYMAEYLRAPVLLVHGEQDTLAFPTESERMSEHLKASGTTTNLLIVPGGERLFNFRQPQQAAVAWDATVEWFDRYLRPTPSG